MLKHVLTACAFLFMSSTWAADNPHVVLTTNQGEIELELDAQKAPISVKNFLGYVESGFYKGTIFHRVIPGFMIQGGGFSESMEQKQTQPPIRNEADNGLKNTRGTLAMARTAAVNSATSQFYINLADNAFLDHGSRDFGYAVFGKVVRGMEVVDKIASVPTGNRGMFQNVPREPILILAAKQL
ncbi:peptidyl-prolyl cis-trans isomerase A (cyclophilin A) [Pseudomonas duriflava]|uniref:Peptidyl-prolyl cis-trans isomerase n=1 Tax=Pseudomonas duriflava TaxID=459528 RepID=A0A562Q7X9_9PSED|nr:peptidylprolyl isomerase [Pseudomonas duriflava]TWI52839.1 peptidyl-prolyl cis-trans isomerase A (cyclophilin A) [Pseudomonas duriflava]